MCSATTPADYVPKSGTVTFPPGVASQTITITICGDKSPPTASQETYKVNLDIPSANAMIYRSPATGTILT